MQTVLTSNRLSLRTLRLFAGLFAYGIAIALMIRPISAPRPGTC